MQVFNFVSKKISIISWIQNLVNLGQIYNIRKKLSKQKLKTQTSTQFKVRAIFEITYQNLPMFFCQTENEETIHLQHKNGKKIVNH